MLSRASQRLVAESQWPSWLPPSFLVPIGARAWLSTVSNVAGTNSLPESLVTSEAKDSAQTFTSAFSNSTRSLARRQDVPMSDESTYTASIPSSRRVAPSQPPSKSTPLSLSKTLRTMLPLLRAQQPTYITLHIHQKGYLVQEGDTIRLPFRMPDVHPGDVLRLNCASMIGSREFTLKAGSADAEAASLAVVHRNGAAINNAPRNPAMTEMQASRLAERRRQKHGYLDDRLFVCRAVVLGVEAEPMRIMEKTKPRQRHIKHVRSKHKYTCLRISEVRLKSVEELDETEDIIEVGGEEGLIAATTRPASSTAA